MKLRLSPTYSCATRSDFGFSQEWGTAVEYEEGEQDEGEQDEEEGE